jgi:hypothetical protein
MKDRRSRVLILVLLAIIAVAVVWRIIYDRTDDAAYRHAIRNMRIAENLRIKCRGLPGAFYSPRFDRFLTKSYDSYNGTEKRLLASGFLTNLSIPLTMPPPFSNHLQSSMDEVSRRLHEAVPDLKWTPSELQDWTPFELQDRSNHQVTLEITCRTNDISAIRNALRDYE